MKLDYTKPELVELGTVADLTAAGSYFGFPDSVYDAPYDRHHHHHHHHIEPSAP